MRSGENGPRRTRRRCRCGAGAGRGRRVKLGPCGDASGVVLKKRNGQVKRVVDVSNLVLELLVLVELL